MNPSFYTRERHGPRAGLVSPLHPTEAVLKPVMTGTGLGMSSTFEVGNEITRASLMTVNQAPRLTTGIGGGGMGALTYGSNVPYSVQPHSHFSVMGHSRTWTPDDPTFHALKQASDPARFPRSVPRTAIEASSLTSDTNSQNEWNLMSWGLRSNGNTLWHTSPAETRDSEASSVGRRTFF